MDVDVIFGRRDPELEAFLLEDPVANLFQLDFLTERTRFARFVVARDKGQIVASTLVVAGGRLLCPNGDPSGCEQIAPHVPTDVEAQRIVGPRAAADGLWAGLGGGPARLHRTHRLMCVTRETLRPHSAPELERAGKDDLEALVAASRSMHQEELGIDPIANNGNRFAASVEARVQAGATHVLRIDGRLVFKVDVGSDSAWGAQLEGVYTVPDVRGHGIATRALSELSNRLLNTRRCVTLHVHDENEPAIRAYTSVGFVDHAAFRLISND